MVIYLKHPVHGRKVANMDLEAQADEAAGWVRYDPYNPEAVEPEAAASDAARPDFSLEPEVKRSPGRPRLHPQKE